MKKVPHPSFSPPNGFLFVYFIYLFFFLLPSVFSLISVRFPSPPFSPISPPVIQPFLSASALFTRSQLAQAQRRCLPEGRIKCNGACQLSTHQVGQSQKAANHRALIGCACHKRTIVELSFGLDGKSGLCSLNSNIDFFSTRGRFALAILTISYFGKTTSFSSRRVTV